MAVLNILQANFVSLVFKKYATFCTFRFNSCEYIFDLHYIDWVLCFKNYAITDFSLLHMWGDGRFIFFKLLLNFYL